MGKRIHLFLLALAIGVIQGAAQVTTVRGIVTTEEDGVTGYRCLSYSKRNCIGYRN